MTYDKKKIAGALLFFAGVQYVLLLIVAEALHPNYSISQNYISDLGTGPSSAIYNISVFLRGICIAVSAYLVYRVFNLRLFSVLLMLMGVGAIGVGLFTEDLLVIHSIFALITFVSGSLSAMVSFKLLNNPLSYFSVILGALSLVAFVLFASGTYLGLGLGGMERLIVYPIMLWVISFGSSLISST